MRLRDIKPGSRCAHKKGFIFLLLACFISRAGSFAEKDFSSQLDLHETRAPDEAEGDQHLFFTDDDQDGYVRPEDASPASKTPDAGSNHKTHPKHERHKDLYPLSKWDYIGIVAAAIGLMIAAGGGVGGGGILVPVYVLLLRFHPKLAIPLSNITIFGGALTNMALNVSKRHPLVDRPLVDWDLILVMEPLTIGGALVGSFINKVLPEEILGVSLVILLAYTANRTLRKGLTVYDKETKALAEQRYKANKSSLHLTTLHEASDDEHESLLTSSSNTLNHDSHSEDEHDDINMNNDNKTHYDTDTNDIEMNDNTEHKQKTTSSNKQISSNITETNRVNIGHDNSNEMSENAIEMSVMKPKTTSTAAPSNSIHDKANENDNKPDNKHDNKHDNSSDLLHDDILDMKESARKATVKHNIYAKELATIIDEEKHMPHTKVFALTCVFIVVLIVNILKGGGAFKSPIGITCGSISFWLSTIFILVWLLVVSFWVRQHLIARYKRKEKCGYKYVDGDVLWDETSTIKYPSLCFFAGFFAGLFGIGGGIVKGPLMIEMGVQPAVASATSACMILYTSFTATTSFLVFGLVRMDYAAFLFIVGVVSTAIGQIGINYLVKKYQRSSIIILSIGAVVALSAILMGGQSLYFYMIPRHNDNDSNNGFCTAGE